MAIARVHAVISSKSYSGSAVVYHCVLVAVLCESSVLIWLRRQTKASGVDE